MPAIPYQSLLQGLELARSALYFAEGLPIEILRRNLNKRAIERPSIELEKMLLEKLNALIQKDTQNIVDGVYPVSVLYPQGIASHLTNYARILADSLKVQWRKSKRKNKEFSEASQIYLDDVPNYYRRNFHFQTDGYLSPDSARLYDHQVEILFRGSADAMRRLFIQPLKELGFERDRKMRVLELGSGTGSSTRFFAQAFPAAEVTCVDLSHPYLKEAQRRLSAYPKVNFLMEDAAHLSAQDQIYDGVFSVFLFHELPEKEREKVLAEAHRVLKPGGFLAIVDSLQMDDDPDLNRSLELFPQEFHEPFYKNYVESNLAEAMEYAGFENIRNGTGFFSKWVVSTKAHGAV